VEAKTVQTADISADRLELPAGTRAKGGQSATRRSPVGVRAESTPEQARLWKVCRKDLSPTSSKVDLVAFVVFAVVSFAAIAFSFFMLFYTLDSGALEQTVRTLMAR